MTFLVRGGHRDRIPALWAGVGVAVLLSFGFGAVLHFTSANMSFEAQEAFGGILSIVAVGFVTWMVFWMKRASHTIKDDLHGKMQEAVELGAFAVGLAALLAVGREGLETALFIYPTFQAQGAGAGPAVGALLGLGTAAFLGWLLYRGAVRLHLGNFFKVTGIALIVIAAGVLAYGVHDLQEAGILPGLDNLAFDVSAVIIPGSILATLLKGLLNISPAMTVLEVVAWFAYLVPTMILYFRAAKPVVVPASEAERAAAAAQVSASAQDVEAPAPGLPEPVVSAERPDPTR